MDLPSRRDLPGAAVDLVTSGLTTLQEQVASAADLPAFRYAMESTKGKVEDGGSAREATVAEFPISKNLAGVSMWLKPGGLRELHWHANAAEWAYVITGRCRVTVIDPDGCSETVDFGPGDVWYFPRGHGHSIQGIGTEDCHFLLVFDNGTFSEFATFSVTDWLAQTPTDVLARNLGVPAAELAGLPKKEVYIALGPVPPEPLPPAPAGSQKLSPLTHRYPLLAQKPRTFDGSTLRVASSAEFPISTTMTGALMTLKPGAIRELHWHPNADEWQYFLSGKARMTVFASGGRSATVEFVPGDVGYVPMGYGHYIENTGDTECSLIIVFNSGRYEEISLTGWLASNPDQLVATNFGLPASLVSRLPRSARFITPGTGA